MASIWEFHTKYPECEQTRGDWWVLGGGGEFWQRLVDSIFAPLFPDLMPQGGVSALGLALIPIVFTYTGWNAVAYIASEVLTPETNLPRQHCWGR